tara:strand:+ start:28 stop:549 length:522 start_codon:yes stop_codon:yes gene_type:complete
MRKFLKIIIIILFLIGAFCLYVLFLTGNLKYSEEIIVNKHIDTVITLFDNPDNLQKWMPELESHELISGNLKEIGSKYKIKAKVDKREMEMIETIITRNLPGELTFSYEMDGVLNIVINRFIKVSDTKTRVVNEQEFQFKGFMKIMGFLIPGAFKKQSRKYLKNFKNFVENQN